MPQGEGMQDYLEVCNSQEARVWGQWEELEMVPIIQPGTYSSVAVGGSRDHSKAEGYMGCDLVY